jgi:glycosyltransferase involved in cell wall biosynthesis
LRDVVLFLHNRYRTTGGEERVVEDLMWLVREHLGEAAELLARSSSALSRGAAGGALLRGGTDAQDVARAVRLGRARVVHAHNLLPAFGWRALAAARAAGARVVLHLHQFRLVCAIGVCYTRGAECTRCHGRNTLPGVRLTCRGARSEALAYGAALALWQRRMVELADAVVVPSIFARERLRELGAPLRWERVHVIAPPVRALQGDDANTPAAAAPAPAGGDRHALVVARLAPEKGIEVAIDACRRVGIPLVIAGDGPERQRLLRLAGAGDVRIAGRVGEQELTRLRAEAAIAVVPSLSGESFGLAAAEAMAAGVPVAASSVGALPELIQDEDALSRPGDAESLAAAITRQLADREAGARARARVRAVCAPPRIALQLAAVYDGQDGRAAHTGTSHAET